MFYYKAIKMYHPIATVSYGIEGDTITENGNSVTICFIPDISCDYLLVSRMAAKCTAEQRTPEQVFNLLDKWFI